MKATTLEKEGVGWSFNYSIPEVLGKRNASFNVLLSVSTFWIIGKMSKCLAKIKAMMVGMGWKTQIEHNL